MSENDLNSKPKVSKWEGEEPAQDTTPKVSKWEGEERPQSTVAPTSKWEGEQEPQSSAAPKTVYGGFEGTNPPVDTPPSPSGQTKKNKLVPIVVAAVAVIAVIGGIIYWNEANRYDYAIESSYVENDTVNDENVTVAEEVADSSETAVDEATVSESEINTAAVETGNGENSDSEHGFELEHDPVAISEADSDTTASTGSAPQGRIVGVTSPLENYSRYNFLYDGDVLTYDDDKYTSRFGIDVSHHQGTIDWHKVKEAGVTFAFIRLGYRGYGEEGNISLDKQFEYNITHAQAEGIDVGVYFFSQALNEEEAKEEAEFVLSVLNGYDIQLPVAYDLITATDGSGRTSNLSVDQFAQNAETFCKLIRGAFYGTTIAFNDTQWPQFESKLDRLTVYNFWYGDYDISGHAQPPFNYDFLQFSNAGHVSGIDTVVDLDIQLLKK